MAAFKTHSGTSVQPDVLHFVVEACYLDSPACF